MVLALEPHESRNTATRTPPSRCCKRPLQQKGGAAVAAPSQPKMPNLGMRRPQLPNVTTPRPICDALDLACGAMSWTRTGHNPI